MSVLADFVLLGHNGVGSYSLADSKTSVFTMAVKSWLDAIVDVVNRDAIPMLWKMNGWEMEGLPTMAYSEIEKVDLTALSQLISTLTAAGMPLFPDDDLENFIRNLAGLPVVNEVTNNGEGV